MGEQTTVCETCGTAEEWWIQIDPVPSRIRVKLGNVWIADSKKTFLVSEAGHPAVYYFPKKDVRFDLLEKSEHHTHCEHKGDASYWNIVTPERVVENAVWGYPQPRPGSGELKEYVTFERTAVDYWYEDFFSDSTGQKLVTLQTSRTFQSD